MKCHYDVLEVAMDASDADIKTAYRKLALKWHPDKNLDNAEEAHEQFLMVQNAYEVLGDKQERAWYDQHRDQILFASKGEDYEDNSLDVFPYFTASCYKGFEDEDKGFYTVYRTVFETIAKEDMEFMEKEDFLEIPSFGTKDSDYDAVVGPFYNFWLGYCTQKTFIWVNPLNPEAIRHRKLFKLIEKDNKKVRQKLKKERNEEVRSLVKFVLKRDKRVQVYKKLQEEKAAEKKLKHENLRREKLLQAKLLNESSSQPEWANFKQFEDELAAREKALAAEFKEELSEEDSDCENTLYCPACNKLFKTDKAFENHTSSKKHKANVELLREALLEEENNLEEEENVSESEENEFKDTENNSKEWEDLESPENLTDDEKVSKKKQKKKKSKVLQHNTHEENLHFENKLESLSEDEDTFSEKKSKKKKPPKKKVEPSIELLDSTLNEDIKVSKKKDRKKGQSSSSVGEIDVAHCCVTCKSNFPSKNKLFQHLKKTNHGVYLAKKLM